MKNQMVAVLTGGVVLVVGGALWFLSGTLQSPERKLAARVDEAAERARRTLDQYSPTTDAIATVVAEGGVGSGLTRERLNELLTDDPRLAEDLIDSGTERLKAISDSRRGPMGDLEARLAELDPDAVPVPPSSPGFGQNVDAQVRILADGVSAQRQLENANQRRLTEALGDIDQALQDSAGERQGSDIAVANRVKAAALFQEAAGLERAAALQREAVVRALRHVAAGARAIAAAQADIGLVESSGIDAAIAGQQKVVAEVEKQRSELTASAAELASQIGDLEERIEAQVATANAARAEMEALERRGLDYGLPDPSQAFAADYAAQAAIYRAATRSAEELRHGTLANARIDASGDMLNGQYVPAGAGDEVAYVRGLDELERQLASLQTRLAGHEDAMQKAQAAAEDLQSLRVEYARRSAAAESLIDELSEKLAGAHATFREQIEVLLTAEDAAIRKYEASAKAFDAAKRAQDLRMQDIQTTSTGLSPEAKERSPYRFIEDDAWISAHAAAQSADARVWAALLLYQRYALAQQALAVLEQANAAAALAEFEPQALVDRAAEAREQGMELAEKAIRELESQASKLRRHWTLAASVAGADYVLAMFGREDALEAAIANYSNVVKDRPEDPRVQIYVDRLAQLRAQER